MDEEELRYLLPHDVFHYEPKYFAGLTVSDMLMAAAPAMLVLTLFHSIVGAAVIAIIALALLKRFDGLGNRSLLLYLYGAFTENRQKRQIIMPRVLPAEGGSLVVTTWDGEVLYRMEGVDDSGTSDL